jgi:acetate kinase
MKVILAINAGSSSVKISVYTALPRQEPKQLAETQISGLTAPPPKLDYSRGGATVYKGKEVHEEVKNQDAAFAILLRTLVEDKALGEIAGPDDVGIVTHRIVHGGDYTAAQPITDATRHHLEELNDLAPLHNAPALEIVDSCLKQLPRALSVACFDSQFHGSLPDHVRTYPIDQVVARKNRLRKYGFHGISYSFIARSVAGFLGKEVEETNIIALHLGSGASACAISQGKSVDTSMGLTPLAGLPGATRSGSVDPRYPFFSSSFFSLSSSALSSHAHSSVIAL